MEIDKDVISAMRACVDHASALLESARAVFNAGHPNIAFHLALLSLEELGRRELIGLQSLAVNQEYPAPTWAEKHSQNHVKKLFWSFFGAPFLSEKLTPEGLESIRQLSKNLHVKRLDGLYLDQGVDGLQIPSEAIQPDECKNIIGLAEARISMAKAISFKESISEEDLALQTWLINSMENIEMRQYMFSDASLSKLAELKDVSSWSNWLKDEYEKIESENRRLAEQEIERSRNIDGKGSKQKWKVRIRLFTDSHSIRPKALNAWNDKVEWIKLIPVSSKKNQLIVEFLLLDNIPIDALWYFAWGLARRFVVALNIGTMGFWWWRKPEQVNSYYESIKDVELGSFVKLERKPSLKIDWGKNRVLTADDINQVAACFAALPGPDEQKQISAFNYYVGGLTFMALNDIHWQCETNIFGNFFECMRAMMVEVGDWNEGSPFEPAIENYLTKYFPSIDDDKNEFLSICRAFEADEPEKVTVTVKEASFAKLFCDAYFMQCYRPLALERSKQNGLID